MTRFRPRQRLRRRAEFDRVFRRGVRVDGRLFVLIAAANGGPENRLGLAVNRRVGAAVARTRVRRLLREAFRRLDQRPLPPVDLVLLAKPEMKGANFGELEQELRERLRRLALARLGGASRDPGH